MYIGDLSKNSSEEVIVELVELFELFELFIVELLIYQTKNCFTEMPTGRKNRYYAFITAPEHVCNELIKLNGVTFQDMCLKVQEARQ